MKSTKVGQSSKYGLKLNRQSSTSSSNSSRNTIKRNISESSEDMSIKQRTSRPPFAIEKLMNLSNDVASIKNFLKSMQKNTEGDLNNLKNNFDFNVNSVANTCMKIAFESSEKIVKKYNEETNEMKIKLDKYETENHSLKKANTENEVTIRNYQLKIHDLEDQMKSVSNINEKNSELSKNFATVESVLQEIAEFVLQDFETIKQNQANHFHLSKNFFPISGLPIKVKIRENLSSFLESLLSSIQASFNNYQSLSHDLQVKNEVLSDQNSQLKKKCDELEQQSFKFQDQVNKSEEQLNDKDSMYLKINEEKKNIEIVAQMLNDENERLKNKVSEMEQTMHILYTNNTNYQNVITNLEGNIAELESFKKITSKDVEKLNENLETFKNNFETEQNSNKQLNERLLNITEDLKQVQLENQVLKSQKSELDELIQTMSKNKSTFETQLFETTQNLDKYENSNKQLEECLKKLEQDKMHLENLLKTKEDTETSMNINIIDLNNDISVLKKELLHIEQIRVELDTEISTLNKKLHDVECLKEQFEFDLNNRSKEVTKLRNENGELTKQVDGSQNDLNRLRHRYELLNETCLKLNESNDNLIKSNEEKDILLNNYSKDIDKMRDLIAQKVNENESLENSYFQEKTNSKSCAEQILDLQNIEKDLKDELDFLKAELNQLKLQKDTEQKSLTESRNLLIEQLKVKEIEFAENVENLKKMNENDLKKSNEQKEYLESYFDGKLKEVTENLNNEKNTEIKKLEDNIERLKLDIRDICLKHEEELIRMENENQKTLIMLQQDNQMLTEKLANLKSEFESLEGEKQILKQEFTEKLEQNKLKISELNSDISNLNIKLDESKLHLENEQNLFDMKLHELNEEKLNLETDNENLKAHLELIEAKSIDKAEELKNTLERLKEDNTQIQSLNNEIQNINKELLTIKCERDTYFDSCTELRNQIKNIECEKREQNRSLEDLMKKLENYENKIKDLENDKLKLFNDYDKSKLNLTETENRIKFLENELNQMKRVDNQKDKDEKDLKNRLNNQVEEYEKIYQEVIQLRKQIRELEEDSQINRQENSKLRLKLAETEELWHTNEKDFLSKLEDCSKKIKNLEDEKHNLEICLSDASQQIHELKTRCQNSENKIKALNLEINDLEYIRKNLEQKLILIIKSLQKTAGIHVKQIGNTKEKGDHEQIDFEIDIDSIKKGLRKLMNQFAHVENERDTLKKQLFELKSKLKSTENKVTSHSEMKTVKLDDKLKLENELKRFKLLLDQRDKNSKLLADTIEEYRKELVGLKAKNSELEIQNFSFKENKRKFDDEIAILKTKFTKSEDDKAKLANVLQQKELDLSKTEVHKISFEGDLKRCQLLLHDKDSNLSKLQEKYDKQSMYVLNLEEKCSTLKSTIDKLNSTLDKLNKNKDSLQKELSLLQKKLDELQFDNRINIDRLQKFKRNLNAAENEKNYQKDRLEKLKFSNLELEKMNNNLSKEMDNAHKDLSRKEMENFENITKYNILTKRMNQNEYLKPTTYSSNELPASASLSSSPALSNISKKYNPYQIKKLFDTNESKYQKQIRSLESQIEILRNQINQNAFDKKRTC